MAHSSDSRTHAKKLSSSHNLPLNRLSTRSFGLQAKPEAAGVETQSQDYQPRSFSHDFTKTPFLQAKLAIGAPGDKYEQEADRVAAQVVQQINAPQTQQAGTVQRDGANPEEESLQTKPIISPLQRQEMPEEEDELQTKSLIQRQEIPEEEDELQTKSLIQRQEMSEEEEELQTKPLIQRQEILEEEDELQTKSLIQRQEMPEEEDELQTKSLIQRQVGRGATVSTDLESSINSARGNGQPLDNSVRGPMEQAFGADFSAVKIHTDPQSDQLNRAVQARAFTTGQDIFFRQGEYQPQTLPGQGLLAHELTHVLQQSATVSRKQNLASSPSENSGNRVPGYLQSIFSSQKGDDGLYRKELQAFRKANGDPVLERYRSEMQEPDRQVKVTQSTPFHGVRLMMRGEPPVAGKPKKQVSSKAMGRLSKARQAIQHTKSVFSQGAGNQTEALKATNFNSQFRLLVMRDNKQLLKAVGEKSFWKLTDEVKPIAQANPEALTAARADLANGGNCGEHSQVAFNYLRVNANGERITRAAKNGLDHAFVLIGEAADTDSDIVVADPWPTQSTATTWEDHFAYTSDRDQIKVYNSLVADGQSKKDVIAAGLTLTDKGKEVITWKHSDPKTKALLKRSKELHFWTHPDAAASGRDYEYHE